eukprot:g25743.t1
MVCPASTSTNTNNQSAISGFFFGWLHCGLRCFVFELFLPCFPFFSVLFSSPVPLFLVRSEIYATEPRSIAPQRCGCVPTLVFCMGSMSPSFFFIVSFCLVFRIVPSAYCRVVSSKITLPASPATKQPTNMSPYVYFFVCSFTACSFVLPLHTRICRFLSTDPFCYGVPSFNINEHQQYPVCYVSFSGRCIMDYAISRVAALWSTLFRLRAVSSLLSFLLCFPLQFRFS